MARVIEDLDEGEAALWAILHDESGLDLAEFTWVDHEKEDNCWRAWDFQHQWWRTPDRLQIDQCARALDITTLLATPAGWTTMGEVCPGDYVFDERGNPTRVNAVSQIWEDRPCYEVCFDDHTSIVADEEHLWLTWDKKARAARNPNRRGRPYPRIRTTKEILDTLTTSYGNERNHAIDVTKPLQIPHADLPLDPYYLGFWLGDGNTITSEITTADPFVLDELVRRGISIIPRANDLLYGVAFPYPHNRKTESVQARLRQLGVLGNKHIPMCYLRASESQRRDLLAGLVDSDGYLQSNGSCEVTQKAFPVAEGLVELLRSLGEKPRIVKKTATLNGVDCGPVYRVTWRPRWNPARLSRKSVNFLSADTKKFHALGQRRIVDVRAVPSRPVRCITVDNPTHLFLAGEGLIPTHNSVGKSLSIQARAFAFPFIHPGQEMLLTAPELNHLEQITTLVETRFMDVRLGKEMLIKGRSRINHRPFQMRFQNGARIIGRIPQRDGRGLKGTHPLCLEMDEAQDMPEKAWIEIFETLKRGHEGATWRAHGVTRGYQDTFYRITTDENSHWKCHKFQSQYRPTWSDQEREEKIADYPGGREDPDYKRNVLGEHSDSASPVFVLARLMRAVDDDIESDYNQNQYHYVQITDEWLRKTETHIDQHLNLPEFHKEKWKTFWCGMDVGWTLSPSEILVFAEERMRKEEYSANKKAGKAVPDSIEQPRLKLVTRISMVRMPSPEQRAAVLRVIDHYRPVAFSFDSTGGGLGIWQEMEADILKYPHIKTAVKGYNFSSNILVDFDDSIEVNEFASMEEQIKEAGVFRNAVLYATDRLRGLVDAGRLWLPWDKEVIGHFQAGKYEMSKGAQYGRTVKKGPNAHCLDAARMAALGWAQHTIELMVKKDQSEAVYDMFIEM